MNDQDGSFGLSRLKKLPQTPASVLKALETSAKRLRLPQAPSNTAKAIEAKAKKESASVTAKPKSRRNPSTTKKGEARKQRRAWEKGSSNESRFYRLILYLISVIMKNPPKGIRNISCLQSPHYNPKKGRTDTPDKQGEDLRVIIEIITSPNITMEYVIVYDAKSIQWKVDWRNKKQRKYRLPRGVDLKKAILVYKRPHQYIVQEVLDDIESVLPKSIIFDKEKILEQFSPI